MRYGRWPGTKHGRRFMRLAGARLRKAVLRTNRRSSRRMSWAAEWDRGGW